ncbi:MAG: phenylalanine-4-hydroxylase [Arenicella sp.]
MQSQEQVIQSLPSHLQPFVATQDYSTYSSRDQAVWRFLIHQLSFSLKGAAHETYFEGLAKTGIGFETIPRIEDINARLNQLGWQAVAVDGFLPPAVFMEFQALKVLAIAVNIRSFEHMLYTPAPDIIHESAGHAPFLIDIDYAEFLQRFGELGMRAIANQHDMDHYQAVRELSIVKEDVNSTAAQIEQVERRVEEIQNTKVEPSEANLLARLHWWTVEYGLVGEVSDYRIYGAGLLSSLSESQSCLNDAKVIKKALTINSIKSAYDITVQQPQLFVTQSCRHLSHVLEEYGRHMCCIAGGSSSLLKAYDAGSIVTVTMNSGLQASGKISRVMCDAVGNAIYFNTDGATQLALGNSELIGHGVNYHAQGFGSPVGRLVGLERCLSAYSIDELSRHGIAVNQQTTLRFLSGVTVKGTLTDILRRQQKNILMSFEDCTVTDVDNAVLFDPSWGTFDMAVGDSIVSVSGGSADQAAFPIYAAPSQSANIKNPDSQYQQHMFLLYRDIRAARENSSNPTKLIQQVLDLEKIDWLVLYETLELIIEQQGDESIRAILIDRLKSEVGDQAILIEQGLQRLQG